MDTLYQDREVCGGRMRCCPLGQGAGAVLPDVAIYRQFCGFSALWRYFWRFDLLAHFVAISGFSWRFLVPYFVATDLGNL